MRKLLLIVAGFLVGLAVVRFFMLDNNQESRELLAYGAAVYHPDEQYVAIHDELDSVHTDKVFVTTYAAFGVNGEKFDWNKKVYVYATGNCVDLISNVNQDEVNFMFYNFDFLDFFQFIPAKVLWFICGVLAFCLLLYLWGEFLFFNLKDKWLTVMMFCRVLVVLVGLLALFDVGESFVKRNDIPKQIALSEQAAQSKNFIYLSDPKSLSQTSYTYVWSDDIFFCSQDKLSSENLSIFAAKLNTLAFFSTKMFALTLSLLLLILMDIGDFILRRIFLKRHIRVLDDFIKQCEAEVNKTELNKSE